MTSLNDRVQQSLSKFSDTDQSPLSGSHGAKASSSESGSTGRHGSPSSRSSRVQSPEEKKKDHIRQRAAEASAPPPSRNGSRSHQSKKSKSRLSPQTIPSFGNTIDNPYTVTADARALIADVLPGAPEDVRFNDVEHLCATMANALLDKNKLLEQKNIEMFEVKKEHEAEIARLHAQLAELRKSERDEAVRAEVLSTQLGVVENFLGDSRTHSSFLKTLVTNDQSVIARGEGQYSRPIQFTWNGATRRGPSHHGHGNNNQSDQSPMRSQHLAVPQPATGLEGTTRPGTSASVNSLDSGIMTRPGSSSAGVRPSSRGSDGTVHGPNSGSTTPLIRPTTPLTGPVHTHHSHHPSHLAPLSIPTPSVSKSLDSTQGQSVQSPMGHTVGGTGGVGTATSQSPLTPGLPGVWSNYSPATPLANSASPSRPLENSLLRSDPGMRARTLLTEHVTTAPNGNLEVDTPPGTPQAVNVIGRGNPDVKGSDTGSRSATALRTASERQSTRSHTPDKALRGSVNSRGSKRGDSRGKVASLSSSGTGSGHGVSGSAGLRTKPLRVPDTGSPLRHGRVSPLKPIICASEVGLPLPPDTRTSAQKKRDAEMSKGSVALDQELAQRKASVQSGGVATMAARDESEDENDDKTKDNGHGVDREVSSMAWQELWDKARNLHLQPTIGHSELRAGPTDVGNRATLLSETFKGNIELNDYVSATLWGISNLGQAAKLDWLESVYAEITAAGKCWTAATDFQQRIGDGNDVSVVAGIIAQMATEMTRAEGARVFLFERRTGAAGGHGSTPVAFDLSKLKHSRVLTLSHKLILAAEAVVSHKAKSGKRAHILPKEHLRAGDTEHHLDSSASAVGSVTANGTAANIQHGESAAVSNRIEMAVAGLAGLVAMTGKVESLTIKSHDDVEATISLDSAVDRLSQPKHIQSALCVPILDQSKGVFAIVEVFNKQGSSKGFTQLDQMWLHFLTKTASQALKSAIAVNRGWSVLTNMRMRAVVCAKGMQSATEISRMLKHMVDNLVVLFDVRRASLYLLDSSGTELFGLSSDSEDNQGTHLRKRTGPIGMVLSSQEPVVIQAVDKTASAKAMASQSRPRFVGDPSVDPHRAGAIVAAPLFNVAGRLVGVGELRDKTCGPFLETDISSFVSLCSMIGVMIDSAHVFSKEVVKSLNAASTPQSVDVPANLGSFLGSESTLQSPTASDSNLNSPTAKQSLLAKGKTSSFDPSSPFAQQLRNRTGAVVTSGSPNSVSPHSGDNSLSNLRDAYRKVRLGLHATSRFVAAGKERPKSAELRRRPEPEREHVHQHAPKLSSTRCSCKCVCHRDGASGFADATFTFPTDSTGNDITERALAALANDPFVSKPVGSKGTYTPVKRTANDRMSTMPAKMDPKRKAVEEKQDEWEERVMHIFSTGLGRPGPEMTGPEQEKANTPSSKRAQSWDWSKHKINEETAETNSDADEAPTPVGDTNLVDETVDEYNDDFENETEDDTAGAGAGADGAGDSSPSTIHRQGSHDLHISTDADALSSKTASVGSKTKSRPSSVLVVPTPSTVSNGVVTSLEEAQKMLYELCTIVGCEHAKLFVVGDVEPELDTGAVRLSRAMFCILGNALLTRNPSNVSGLPLPRRHRIVEGVVGHCAMSGKVFNVSNAYLDKFFSNDTDGCPNENMFVMNVLSAPIRAKSVIPGRAGRVVGVLHVINSQDDNGFNCEDESTVATYADALSYIASEYAI